MMIKAARQLEGLRDAVVAPHALAAEAGAGVLAEGGNAIEAMVAAAASIAVVYPHMNSLGGDGFWLIEAPGAPAVGIDASGVAVAAATPEWYRDRQLAQIPHRGPGAANTVAGTVSGWALALEHARRTVGQTLPLDRLLAPAIASAVDGIEVTRSQYETLSAKIHELDSQPGFADCFLIDGKAPQAQTVWRQPALAATLRQLAHAGLDDFYRGELAQALANGLAAVGSPLTAADLQAYCAQEVTPLQLDTPAGRLLNLPPPTQGVASLLILGLYQQILAQYPHAVDSATYVHALVEATKLAFEVRDRLVTDPARVPIDPAEMLDEGWLHAAAGAFDPDSAAPWPRSSAVGDTVWLGAIDRNGLAVSFIQSTYHEFGSGIVAGDTGVVWQNRGCSFSLEPGNLNALEPGRRPFHTLNPPIARLPDGRRLVYGTMGGEGQPQTQAALFTRAAIHGLDPGAAVAAPRWLLGRTWGSGSDALKVEEDFPPQVVDGLRTRGHEIEQVAACNAMMGHAGMLWVDASGLIAGASDPRCDGAVAGTV